jgi:hypothetical protein
VQVLLKEDSIVCAHNSTSTTDITSFPVDTKAVARKFHMSGGSVRLAIKNSLGAPEPNNQQLPRRDASNNQKAQSGKKSAMIKFTANPTIVDMWSSHREQ